MLSRATRVRPMVAGTGVIGGGLRGTPPIQPAEQSLCNASRPASALLSSSSLSAKATGGLDVAAKVPMKAINANDLQFMGDENELVMEAGEPVPRLVFGGVPSLQEAKEATAELKEALDMVYMSPPISSESETSSIPGFSLSLNTEKVENRFGKIMEKKTSSPGPEHVFQAFKMFSSSTEMQTVVASIASDQNVFNAVRENPDVKQFILANQTGFDTFEDEADVTQVGEPGAAFIEKLRSMKSPGAAFMEKLKSMKSPVAALMEKLGNMQTKVIKMVINIPIYFPNLFGSSTAETASVSDRKANTQSSPIGWSLRKSLMSFFATKKDCKPGTGFVQKLRDLKNSVVEIATNKPIYVPNLLGASSAEESGGGSDDKGNAESSPIDWSLGQYLTGLAIMVIMIVLLKRV